MPKILSVLLFCMLTTVAIGNETVELKHDFPKKYTVQKGDTLWQIAERLLQNPAKWRLLWQQNQQLQDPDKLYPGDVIRIGANQKVYYHPIAGKHRLKQARLPIAPIPMKALKPFLKDFEMLPSKEALAHIPEIASLAGGHLIAGTGDSFYAKGLKTPSISHYRIVRLGKAYQDMGSKKVLGYGLHEIGRAKLVQYGDISLFKITSARQEIQPGDGLVPRDMALTLPPFAPTLPNYNASGRILSVLNGSQIVGQYQVVILNKGVHQGVSKGQVFGIYSKEQNTRRTYRKRKKAVLPPRQIGTLMVVREYENLSLALVLNASEPIRIYDRIASPRFG